MSPKDLTVNLPNRVQRYLKALKDSDYSGEILTSHADRLINATDNSIYQVMPQSVLAPRVQKDLNIIMESGAHEDYKSVKFMPRGGGTGTNGQSLNDCIIIDTSKYLTRILEINKSEGWVKVEPGVVLDQLNAELQKQNLFFPVHISPSKSCTLGGMVATDACGKGSRVFGKTSDYCISLSCLLADGREIETQNYFNDDLSDMLAQNMDEIKKHAPQMPRGLSAFDLIGAFDNNQLNMTKLIAGSEGSLAVLKEIKLKVIPKPDPKTLVAVFYDDFDTALRHATDILEHNPLAIETIDDRILDLARGDILWHDFKAIFPKKVDPSAIGALHCIEFADDVPATLLKALEDHPSILGFSVHIDPDQVKNVTALRSKCVGLLGNMEGYRRPIPFIEDTAVPPENLADYIADLKALLTSHNLECGMFGHVDAGCLHVRPALDLRLEEDEAFIRTLTDEVVTLVQKYGGVLWGEHGKGMRSEYTEQLVGTPYYKVMQDVKALLDPHNKLNPGKIAGPHVKAIDDVPLRSQHDRQISDEHNVTFPKATQCNGNGLCFSAMSDDTMCPSYKITKDRKHSPKGRAAMLREWMQLDNTDKKAADTFSHEVFDALHGCLSCKACTSTCPIHVNIPDMKVDFLNRYYKGKHRPYRDYLIGRAETFSSFAHLLPKFDRLFGLVDLPSASKRTKEILLKNKDYPPPTPENIKRTENPVIVVQDAYTTFYEPELVKSVLELLQKLGYTPLLAPFRQSGKSWHVRGFSEKFKNIALANIAHLENMSELGAPMIGIDPSITLVYRDEYHKILDRKPKYSVLLLQEFLSVVVQSRDLPKIQKIPQSTYPLFLHCTEKTMKPQSADEWATLLKAFDINTEVIETGCCGMAGAYGHEAEHVEYSKGLYELSWKGKVNDTALVTGYSCRSQIHRLEDFTVKHPLELLNELL
ncbi:MAG: FAD-binding and (Fe-S)-binding domain-containing protein [Pseudomonadota bacterium]